MVGGSEVGLLREQQRVFTVAAEHLQVAADADSEYLDDAENVARMAANAADAVALLEEHGEDVASWDAAAEEAWGAYAIDQADAIGSLVQFCNVVDPPDRSPSEG